MAQSEKIIDITPEQEPERKMLIIELKNVRGKSSYYARWRVPMESRKNKNNAYATKALGTIDLDDAKKKAYAWWKQVSIHTADGAPLYVPTFREVAVKFINDMELETERQGRHGDALLSLEDFRRYRGALQRYLIPYFGEDRIDRIPDTKLKGYERWRKNYYISGPGKNETEIRYKRDGKTLSRPSQKSDDPAYSTIQKEVVAFNKVIDFATVSENVSFNTLPRIERKRQKIREPNRRPHFEDDALALLFEGLGKRVYEVKNKATRRNRLMLYCFCGILLYSGVRVAEAYQIKFGHITPYTPEEEKKAELENIRQGKLFQIPSAIAKSMEAEDRKNLEDKCENWNNDLELDSIIDPETYENTIRKFAERDLYYKITIPKSKDCKHRRDIFADARISHFMNILVSLYYDPVYKNLVGDAHGGVKGMPRDMFLFSHPDGSPIGRIDKSFIKALNTIKNEKYPDGLRRNLDGKDHTLTSFRHTYATEILLKNKATVYELAAQMGTSVKMIERHYGHIKPDDFAVKFL